METSILVKGMSCASCVSHVEKALKKIEGVEDVSVNLATEKAFVKFEESKVKMESLLLAIKDAGYEPSLDQNSDQKKKT